MKAMIFDIQRLSFVDGPGIRTTVFFKGCNLKCSWCHNPESQDFGKQLLFYKNKCIGCGKCSEVCSKPRQECSACGKCLDVCRSGARVVCGREMTVDELYSEITKDQIFYESSGGGVTFSGGECMLQSEFLAEILKLCKQEGIHTAVDTAGNVSWEHFLKIIPYTDIFLYDIKSMNSQIHKKYVGVGNELILENLVKLLEQSVRIWVRVPIVSGINDNETEMFEIKKFYRKHGYPEKTELLPYHKIGENKYQALGRKMEIFTQPSEQIINKLYLKLLE